jgi:hypothetical protein
MRKEAPPPGGVSNSDWPAHGNKTARPTAPTTSIGGSCCHGRHDRTSGDFLRC